MRRRISLLASAALLVGCVAARAAGPLKFYSINPCRLINTMDTQGPPLTIGPALQHGELRNLPIWGASARSCGIPAHAVGLAVNAVVKSPTGGGYLLLFPAGAPLPVASTINFNPGEVALANGASVPLTDDATLQLSVFAAMWAPGNTVHFILDATGYFR